MICVSISTVMVRKLFNVKEPMNHKIKKKGGQKMFGMIQEILAMLFWLVSRKHRESVNRIWRFTALELNKISPDAYDESVDPLQY